MRTLLQALGLLPLALLLMAAACEGGPEPAHFASARVETPLLDLVDDDGLGWKFEIQDAGGRAVYEAVCPTFPCSGGGGGLVGTSRSYYGVLMDVDEGVSAADTTYELVAVMEPFTAQDVRDAFEADSAFVEESGGVVLTLSE